MAKFSLACSTRRQPRQPSKSSPPPCSPPAGKTPPQWKWNFPPQDQYYRSPNDGNGSDGDWSEDEPSTSWESTSEESGHSADSSDSDDDDEEDPPHPLGFESPYGRTQFGLSPRSTWRNRGRPPPPRDIHDREDEYAWNALVRVDDEWRNPSTPRQCFPPIRGYHLRHDGIPTRLLLDGASRREGESMADLLSGMDRIAHLVRAAGHVDAVHRRRSPPPRSTAKLLRLAQACERQQSALPRERTALEQRRERDHRRSCKGFLLLLEADAARASDAERRIAAREREVAETARQERLDREAHEEALRKRREEAERAEAERAAAEAAAREAEREREAAKQELLRRAEEEAVAEVKKKDSHVDRAVYLIDNLATLRSGLKEFDKSKSVGRRRLQFKKIVNGRINTLSHDEHKILEVGRTVCDAISKAASDDAAAAGGEPVLGMGRKYLIDLLCANLIVRAQADGFNGTRGDGFPLAGMFAFISTKCQEIGPVLEGHLYSVCPMAIPALTLNGGSGDHEDTLMEGLGMHRGKDGQFESFDKFLSRTEGLISILADIMSCLPSDHNLLGGHRGALTWLERFMDLMPPPPTSPLPLLTAPVLVAFLSGAGHMLANRYPTEFRSIFDTMKINILNRLDDSPVGVPSATRLRKVLEGWGFDGLRKDPPPGAVAALYDNGRDAPVGDGPGGGGAAPLPSFGAGAAAPSAFSPGAPAASRSGTAPAPAAPTVAPSPSPFGTAPAPSQFGVAPAPASSPFGFTPAPSPFGSAPAAPPFETAPSPSPFGAAPAPSTFGEPPAPAPSPFGAAAAPSAFGVSPAPSQSLFGATPASSAFGASPAPSAPFGAAPTSSAPSPFVAASGSALFGKAPSPSSFGATPSTAPFGTAPAPSPFGGVAPDPSPFGAAPAPSPFGRGGGDADNKKQPCKFFAQGKCAFGERCKFSHEIGSGGGGSNPSPFCNPVGQPSNAFGGNGSNKQPCKFFANGTCRNGDRCKFSHELPTGSSNPSPFGGQTFGAANKSPFGGGGFGDQQPGNKPSPFGSGTGSVFGSGSSGFGSSPFQGPRR